MRSGLIFVFPIVTASKGQRILTMSEVNGHPGGSRSLCCEPDENCLEPVVERDLDPCRLVGDRGRDRACKVAMLVERASIMVASLKQVLVDRDGHLDRSRRVSRRDDERGHGRVT